MSKHRRFCRVRRSTEFKKIGQQDTTERGVCTSACNHDHETKIQVKVASTTPCVAVRKPSPAIQDLHERLHGKLMRLAPGARQRPHHFCNLKRRNGWTSHLRRPQVQPEQRTQRESTRQRPLLQPENVESTWTAGHTKHA